MMDSCMGDEDQGFVPVRRRGRSRKDFQETGSAPYDSRGDSVAAPSLDVLQPAADDLTLGAGVEEEESPPAASAASDRSLPSSSQPRTTSSAAAKKQSPTVRFEVRRLLVPPHRMSPLRKQWTEILEPLVTHLKLQVRMNLRRRCVELRTRVGAAAQKDEASVRDSVQANSSLLQKGSDFVRAFLLGFEVRDAIALLRLDDLFIESFEIKDVKRLNGDHLSRCIARLNGREGKTKYAIENATRTRLVFADSRIHILGSFENIKLARHSICSLVLGAPPGKVYNHLRTVTRRLAERL
ncbi:putative pre-rRNA-processing protein PNO1 [Toxoplasma gondii RUB]|uniref:Pre-rRNA-processing protein PNO1 n=10 Tax=Toxoplasma gondii TaxID=5811 RepID=B9Q2D7_TOXGV|nr:putative pre-rRNA-processing protein PNO1 [Toxoplasma gondii GT1]ESS28474.1 putative pre-rRNA-processing protein PNO1 [Toxoplasma gondii VEG]KAF4643627.1 putative pre-rRNA-processing protein PNO1 [Toxoplasma gondii]KFG30446.1 putative pre-rRNA-processing protein PNO1 [Toxoplasma gondii GAB2-2007-GAL-DOM2]KFG63039.1 putative pre-rRNA-processing protein PNO1 [Toxoplasma gondii RUB]KFH00050.1 putative pre-rRNA-processing protein PNO1 [Toxoplasma gondii VAND]KFH05401.1 putative pre-rRNA-proces